jgi:hypothetical protein
MLLKLLCRGIGGRWTFLGTDAAPGGRHCGQRAGASQGRSAARTRQDRLGQLASQLDLTGSLSSYVELTSQGPLVLWRGSLRATLV